MTDITMRQMLEAGVHFGHQTRYWNPKMAPYIYGAHHKIHIINLEETLPLFRRAMQFAVEVAAKRGKILLVGTKHAARDIVREEATRCGMPYVDYRWLGGMLTNYKTIRQSIKRLKELEEYIANEENLVDMTKKEVLSLMRRKDKLSSNLSGIKNMGSLPDALFVIDVTHEKIAIQEAQRLGIPIIGVVDTNSSPDGIDYLIPGNDDALRAIRLYCQTLAEMIIQARGSLELTNLKQKEEEKPEATTKRVITKKSKIKLLEELALDEDLEGEEEIATPASKKSKAKTQSKKDTLTTVEDKPTEETTPSDNQS
ncbi:MAG: 30S ribosomal protein S2 [Coxiella sp. RIFCSPHIGHO2_12_FULL_44_14]|nr:MAG: 30S ribosomal protein S2 [Coxiella sp. RIFCSPHIGHO2_12_FULL_44_14]